MVAQPVRNRRLRDRAKETVARGITRMFLPQLAKKMEEEGTFHLFEGENAPVNLDDYFVVDDRGADLTIFAFAGMDVLFAGEPRFEFRKQLSSLNQPFNMVFVREMRRMLYHVSPYGKPDGLEFYTKHIEEIKNRIGASRNVAMGSSGGGSAAFFFGSLCGFDKIIAFSPAFPWGTWTSWPAQSHCYFDLKKLVTAPGEYAESALVAASGLMVEYQMYRDLGQERLWNVNEAYLNRSPRVPATIIYGERCYPDKMQALKLKHEPGVKLIPVKTGRHNCPAALKAEGRLSQVLLDEIKPLLDPEPVSSS